MNDIPWSQPTGGNWHALSSLFQHFHDFGHIKCSDWRTVWTESTILQWTTVTLLTNVQNQSRNSSQFCAACPSGAKHLRYVRPPSSDKHVGLLMLAFSSEHRTVRRCHCNESLVQICRLLMWTSALLTFKHSSRLHCLCEWGGWTNSYFSCSLKENLFSEMLRLLWPLTSSLFQLAAWNMEHLWTSER